MNAEKITELIRKKPLLFAAGAIAVLLAGIIYIRGANYSEAEHRLEELMQEAARIDENIKNSLNLESHLDSLRSISDNVESRLIRPADRIRNQQYFYQLEAETGVNITSLQQRPVATSDDNGSEYIPVGYDVGLTGNYTNIIRFINAVENGDHFARIRGFDIVRSGRGGDSTVINMTVNIQLLGRI